MDIRRPQRSARQQIGSTIHLPTENRDTKFYCLCFLKKNTFFKHFTMNLKLRKADKIGFQVNS